MTAFAGANPAGISMFTRTNPDTGNEEVWIGSYRIPLDEFKAGLVAEGIVDAPKSAPAKKARSSD